MHAAVVIAAGLVGVAPAAHAGILTQFLGGSLGSEENLGSAFIPPDMGGAVGGGYVLQMINGQVTTYTTGGAQVGAAQTLNSFWSGLSVSLGGTNVSDPRVVFDRSSNRWFASAISTQSTSNNILLAVSKSSDPTAGFNAFSITAPGNFADFPTLGVNGAAVTIGTNNFSSASGSATGVSVYSVPKSSLVSATPSLAGMTSFTGTTATGFTPQPVTDTASGGTSTLLLSVNSGSSGLNVAAISNADTASASIHNLGTFIGVQGQSPQAPTQPGGTAYDQGDNRLSSGPYQVGNLIYYANSIWNGSSDVIQWGVIDASTYTLVQTGTISMPGLDLTYPSISANGNGTFVIGFNGSGAGTNISAYSAICSESSGTCGAPFLVYAGQASNYNLTFGGTKNRWGDYSAAAVDPSNPNDFWLFQQYPVTNASWGTVISQISTAVPEPSTIALFGVGLVGLGLIRRRRCAGQTAAD